MSIAICYNAFAMDMQLKYEEGDHLEPEGGKMVLVFWWCHHGTYLAWMQMVC